MIAPSTYRRMAACAVAAFLVAGGAALLAQSGIQAFTDTYLSTFLDWNICAVPSVIVGYEPTTPGPHPVFVYAVGSLSAVDSPDAVAALQGMARRGFVAISPSYFNVFAPNCQSLQAKARCLYGSTSPTSALGKVCARPSADCNKGIVVGGFSQGAHVGLLAANYDARVQAVWGMGASHVPPTPADTCLNSGSRVLPADRFRAINGDHDVFAPDQTQPQILTGLVCPWGQKSCFRPNGSGWYRVQDAEVQLGYASHLFFYNWWTARLDTGFASPAYREWSLDRNLDWLLSFIAR